MDEHTSTPPGVAPDRRHRMTPAQRRVTLVVSAMVGLTLLVVAGLTFLMPPMAEDLRLSDTTVELAFAVPSIAALLIIFVAGQLGEQLGDRLVVIVSGGGFTLGSLLVAGAHGATAVTIGLGVCGATATALQIVALDLLQRTVPHGPAHTSAFTTYGMVFPLAFLVVPIATAGLLEVTAWRWIPIVWAGAGLVIVLAGWLGLDRSPERRPVGDWLTPLLAGVVVATLARICEEIGHANVGSVRMLATLAAGVLAGGSCALLVRRPRPSGFGFGPIRGLDLRAMLGGVAAVTLVAMLTYVTVAMEHLYGWSILDVALAVVPAQVGAVVGAKGLASWAITRWGTERAGRVLLLAVGPSTLPLVLVQPGTPPWYLIAVATVFSGLGMAALTVLNAGVMARAPLDATGPVSAFRGAASALGSGLGVVVLGTGVISATQMDADGPVGSAGLDRLAGALRLDGVLACGLALAGWLALVLLERRAHRGGRGDLGDREDAAATPTP